MCGFGHSKPWGRVCVGNRALFPTVKHLVKLHVAYQKYDYRNGYIDKVLEKSMWYYYLTIVKIMSC